MDLKNTKPGDVLLRFVYEDTDLRARLAVLDHGIFGHDLREDRYFHVEVDGWDFLTHMDMLGYGDGQIRAEVGKYAAQQYRLRLSNDKDERDESWAYLISADDFDRATTGSN